jgi:hypothetical protein
MIFCDERKICFIKGVKVAGTSIEVVLSQHVAPTAIVTPFGRPEPGHNPRNYQMADGRTFSNHMPVREVRARLGAKRFEAVESFAVIRNPVEKMISYYLMKVETHGPDFTLDRAFEDLTSEAKRLIDEKGRVGVTTILDYDHLDAGLAAVFGRHAIPFAGTLGVRAKGGYRERQGHRTPAFNGRQMAALRERFSFEFDHAKRAGWAWGTDPVGAVTAGGGA